MKLKSLPAPPPKAESPPGRNKVAYSLREVREATTLCKSTFAKLLATKALPYTRVGNRVLVLTEDLMEFLHKRKITD